MTRPGTTLRVAIVDDHALFAESLAVVLTLEGHETQRVRLDDPATSTTSVLSAVLRGRPHVVLLDLDLAHVGNSTRLVGPLNRAGVAVVVVTGSVDPVRWGECLLHGARAVLSKSAGPASGATVSAALASIAGGRPAMDPELREELVATYHRDRSARQDDRGRTGPVPWRVPPCPTP